VSTARKQVRADSKGRPHHAAATGEFALKRSDARSSKMLATTVLAPRGRSAPALVATERDAVSEELVHHLGRTLDDVAEGRFGPAADGESGWTRVGNYTQAGERVKDALDRVLAAIGLVLASPVLLAVAIAIRIDSPGPAFLRHSRIGRDGRPFHFWQFRGMYADARRRFPELYDYRESAEPGRTPRTHPPTDPRVTRVGRFIRRTSLDELPNLVNVVLGEMSLVGPRPEIPELVPYYGAAAKLVLGVKPCILSLARLLGPDDMTFEQSLELDLRYVRERSPRMDLGIVLGTAWTIVTGRSIAR
jgi:lipopolysaccharide/colanic/teichoic acid biosynthesis glycosyltransferase